MLRHFSLATLPRGPHYMFWLDDNSSVELLNAMFEKGWRIARSEKQSDGREMFLAFILPANIDEASNGSAANRAISPTQLEYRQMGRAVRTLLILERNTGEAEQMAVAVPRNSSGYVDTGVVFKTIEREMPDWLVRTTFFNEGMSVVILERQLAPDEDEA